MGECESRGVHRFNVAGEVTWRADFTLIGTTLSPSEEVITRKNLMNVGILVRRRIRGRIGISDAEGFEIRDCEGNEVTV